MDNLEFRKLCDSEFDQAYAIICDAVDWLSSKNIRQWTVPLPRKVFLTRQRRGQNYALICDDVLAVILSLVKESSPHWLDQTGSMACWWLSTVATASDFRGQGLGHKAVQQANDYLCEIGAGEVYLDCVHGDGFLRTYYESLRFALLDRKTIEYPTGLFDMVLMKCLLDPRPGRDYSPL